MTTNNWFQTSGDDIQHVVRVEHDARRVSLTVKPVNGGAGWSQVHLTLEEAAQLAAMLNLSMRHARAAAIRAAGLGVQDPPDDPRIYNRKREDGSYPPLSGFFDAAKRRG